MMDKALLTIKDVTEYLKLNRMTIYRMVQKGDLPAVKIAGEWRFDKVLIDKWLEGKLKKVKEPAMAEQTIKEEPKKPEKTVLVVDDEKDICDFFIYLLMHEGYHVQYATNGQKALNMIKEVKPDLILLDLEMPGMDGFEVLKELRKINSSTPVIILTEYGELDLNIKATRLGVHNCITKPFDLEKTKRAIEEAVEEL